MQVSQNTAYSNSLLVDVLSDEESDYSIGDISLITESDCESIESHDEDSPDEHVELTETDILQIERECDQCNDDVEECGEIETPVAMELDQVGTAQAAEAITSNVTHQVENTDSNTGATTDSYGYVDVIDNLDMNIRPSFQRIDRTTESYHFCHAYAVLNRVDTSELEDRPLSGTLSCDVILPDAHDFQQIRNDIGVLVKR